ncbi:EndoU domain-containing protein [Clostridium felsineum]|uniref:EndoU domain-containing protein n=1 Tax=Clostridium felsineum TaxID=36839 RepID=UPI00098CA627|nr:EndoU domain-containing protein [Clostridium felsineum]URZ04281.1 Ribonuclease [Clostridium felsineum]
MPLVESAGIALAGHGIGMFGSSLYNMGSDFSKGNFYFSEANNESSISNLKNVGNFRGGALNHILEGQINGSGMATGYHYENFPNAKGEIIEETKSKPNEFGIYKGKVKIGTVIKRAKSSFFPEDWSAQRVVDSINEAYSNREFVKGTNNTFVGETKNGMQIKMFINKNKKIISAFPIY